ncbi:MAG TPA: phosphopyruvate hydratase, partial [archaeon]|nr:phosphopyruvate hydratase [archaeon]
MKIKSVKAREVIDSRGKPTVEAEVNGFRAIAPSGASRGKYEAIELRDGGKRFGGNGVRRAVDNINKIIAPKIIGKDLDQKKLDSVLCDMAGNNKWKLGGNATTAVSMAFCRASGEKIYDTVCKLSESKPSIPIPFMNVINGGAHACNSLAIQEFMIVPVKAKTFSEALQAGCEVY